MRKVLVSVEGQTEETFVRELLIRRFLDIQILLIPVILTTSRTSQGRKFKSGLTTYGRARNDINSLLRDTNATAVTTMYDLYHLPNDFPGVSSCPAGDCFSRTAYLEEKFFRDIGDSRFRPYLQIHEFEAILFVQPEKTAGYFPDVHRLNDLIRIRQSFNSPEEINNGAKTAPSKRILSLYPNYEKPLYGPLIAIEIGLEAILEACPHFHDWIGWMESI